jgi:carbonic anhydrase/acetyltransferase-like protein (isoleucine patch superfamily)
MIYELDGIAPELGADGDVWVAPSAAVIGKVRMAPGAAVWFGAVLRGDLEWIDIGADTNIQDNAVIHTDMDNPTTIGARVTIGHAAIIHGCTIGDDVLIGMGATILNGAVIPDGCLVGANALVTENKTFEPGSLIVGAPAKAVKTLSPEAIAGIGRHAAKYADNARRFAKGLKAIG